MQALFAKVACISASKRGGMARRPPFHGKASRTAGACFTWEPLRSCPQVCSTISHQTQSSSPGPAAAMPAASLLPMRGAGLLPRPGQTPAHTQQLQCRLAASAQNVDCTTISRVSWCACMSCKEPRHGICSSLLHLRPHNAIQLSVRTCSQQLCSVQVQVDDGHKEQHPHLLTRGGALALAALGGGSYPCRGAPSSTGPPFAVRAPSGRRVGWRTPASAWHPSPAGPCCGVDSPRPCGAGLLASRGHAPRALPQPVLLLLCRLAGRPAAAVAGSGGRRVA